MGFKCHPNKCFECIQYPMIGKYDFVYECSYPVLSEIYESNHQDVWDIANRVYGVIGEKYEQGVEISNDEAIFFGDCLSRFWMFGLTRKRFIDSYQIQEVMPIVKQSRQKSMPAIGVVAVIERTKTTSKDFPNCWLEVNCVRSEDKEISSKDSEDSSGKEKRNSDQSQLSLGWMDS